MAAHIPFVTGDDACALANDVYADSTFVRVGLDRAERHCHHLHATTKVWLDAGVDGMDDLRTRRTEWLDFMRGFPHFAKIADRAYHAKPVAAEVCDFVKSVMDQCAMRKSVGWITVPQLPLVDDSARNRINHELAVAAGRWKSRNKAFSGRLILPLVFTNQRQVNRKTERNPKVQQADRCYRASQADGLWVVESTLRDDDGSSTLGKRLPAVILLHEELNASISSKIRIAGPYWGLNLVLWAKGLVDYPAIGVGSGYQFLTTGGHAQHPVVRLALRSLRRRVSYRPELVAWLDDAIGRLAGSHPAHKEFSDIRKRFAALGGQDSARKQIATFYKEWFDAIAARPSAGRSMALYQDLSTAFALGRSLPDLPEKGTARRPEAVAKHLMLNCL